MPSFSPALWFYWSPFWSFYTMCVCGRMIFYWQKISAWAVAKSVWLGFRSKWYAELAAHRSHDFLVSVTNLLSIQAVVYSCSQPLTAHFNAAQIQTFIPTFHTQPNVFTKDCSVFRRRFLERQITKLKIGSGTFYSFSCSSRNGSAEYLMWIRE